MQLLLVCLSQLLCYRLCRCDAGNPLSTWKLEVSTLCNAGDYAAKGTDPEAAAELINALYTTLLCPTHCVYLLMGGLQSARQGSAAANQHAMHSAIVSLSPDYDLQLAAQLNAIACVARLCIAEARLGQASHQNSMGFWNEAAKRKGTFDTAASCIAAAFQVPANMLHNVKSTKAEPLRCHALTSMVFGSSPADSRAASGCLWCEPMQLSLRLKYPASVHMKHLFTSRSIFQCAVIDCGILLLSFSSQTQSAALQAWHLWHQGPALHEAHLKQACSMPQVPLPWSTECCVALVRAVYTITQLRVVLTYPPAVAKV